MVAIISFIHSSSPGGGGGGIFDLPSYGGDQSILARVLQCGRFTAPPPNKPFKERLRHDGLFPNLFFN